MPEIQNKKTVVAIGKFDGVHIGHKELMKKVEEVSKENNLVPSALIINNDNKNLIYTPFERDNLLHMSGIENIFLENLSIEFMNMTAEDFIEKIVIKKYNASYVIVGYNFRFAKNRSADVHDLKTICDKFNLGCSIINEVKSYDSSQKEITVSSSLIKHYLKDGDMVSVKNMLGRYYFVLGNVNEGKKIGRQIGFPTANTDFDGNKILPQSGVYATVSCVKGKNYFSITNIGDNPTVSQEGKIAIETHIIDFDSMIYSEKIKIIFIEKIRDEKKFSSLEELKKQIEKDKEKAVLILKSKVDKNKLV